MSSRTPTGWQIQRYYCRTAMASEQMLEQAMKGQGLSGRAYDRILKVSRTIADLEGYAAIGLNHVSEAVGYRSLECNTSGDLKPDLPPIQSTFVSFVVKLRS